MKCQGSLEGEQITKLFVYRGRTWAQQRPCARRSFSFEKKRKRERSACAQTSAGCYENSNEICVSYVGDHWLVPHTSLTHSLNRPSPLMLVYPSKRIGFKRDLGPFLRFILPLRNFVCIIVSIIRVPLNLWRGSVTQLNLLLWIFLGVINYPYNFLENYIFSFSLKIRNYMAIFPVILCLFNFRWNRERERGLVFLMN